MKLVQLNIWGGRLPLQIQKLLQAQQADVICLQEVYSCPTVNLGITFEHYNVLEQLQQALDMPFAFFAPTWSFTALGEKIFLGNSILSKHDLQNQSTVFVSGEYQHRTTIQEKLPNVRNLQSAQLQIGDKRLTIANHHGYWDKDPMGNQTSVEKMQLAKKYLESLEQPLIFVGDLNVRSGSPALAMFKDFLEDLTATHQITTTLSSLGKVPDVACDHIFVSPQINVQHFEVSEELVSDHKALILEFDI